MSFNPKKRNRVSEQVTIAFYRIAQAIGYLLRERGKHMLLSPSQINALLFLRYARPGVRNIGGLAERLGTTYATSSGVADSLEKKRLVMRKPLPADQRVITLDLTTKGEAQVEQLEDVLGEIEKAIEALPEKEQTILLHATKAIVRHLQNAGYVKVYEMCWGCQFFRKNAHPDDPRGPHHCTFIDAPLTENNTYYECPDFVPIND